MLADVSQMLMCWNFKISYYYGISSIVILWLIQFMLSFGFAFTCIESTSFVY